MLKYVILLGGVVFAGLLGVGFWYYMPDPIDNLKVISYAELPVAQIDSIVFEGPMAITLVRRGEQWHLDNGKRADNDTVQLFLHQLQQMHSDDVITADAGRYHDLGVDSAQGHRLTLKAGKQQLASFVVGKTFGYNQVIRLGSKVWRFLQTSNNALVRHPSQWESKILLQDPFERISKLSVLLHQQQPYHLERREQGFVLTEQVALPADFRFSPGRALHMIGNLAQLRAMEVLYPDPGEQVHHLGEQADRLEWTIAADPNEPTSQAITRVLRLGADKDNYTCYAALAGKAEPFTIPKHVADSLRSPLSAFRDLSLLKRQGLHDIVKVSLQQGSKRMVLLKDKGNQWLIGADSAPMPSNTSLDVIKIFRYISQLQTARGSAVAAQQAIAKRNFLPPRAVVTLYEQDGQQQKLSIGAGAGPDEGHLYALGSQDDLIYTVTSEQYEQWFVDWSAWWPAADGAKQDAKDNAQPSKPAQQTLQVQEAP